MQTLFLASLVLAVVPSETVAPPASAPASQVAETTGGNRLFRTPNDVHTLLMETFPDVCSAGAAHAPAEAVQKRASSTNRVYTSRVLRTPFPFNDLVPSWNVDVPPGAGFAVEIRVGRDQGDFWTPYYYLGRWGEAPKLEQKVVKDENGFINVDYFQSTARFDRLQYRFHFAASDPQRPAVLRRVAFACSNTLNDAELARKHRRTVDPGPKEQWVRRLPVPFRSQKWESEELRSQICSPTSVSMVLEYRGIKRPTTEVCATILDREYHMYGNWWRAVQGAYTYGLPGYVERFGDWNAVKRHIAAGQPIIASIRVRRGQLRNAPYRQSDGHLLVITGFDDEGNVLINDPAASTPEQGITKYYREDMERIWMDRGGVGYILLPPPAPQAAR